MHATKVEIALRRYISDVGSDTPFLAEFINLSRSNRVVDGAEDHVGVVEVRGLECAVDVDDLIFGDTMRSLLVETSAGAHYRYFGVGIEDVKDSPRCNLYRV
jgi:hypothetical protein